jgi:hypothetical protein
MNTITFDILKFTRKLESVGIPREHAAGIIEALADAQHESNESLATKGDIIGLKSDITALESKMREQELRMTIKLGTLMFIAAGVTGGIVITTIRLMFGKLL